MQINFFQEELTQRAVEFYRKFEIHSDGFLMYKYNLSKKQAEKTIEKAKCMIKSINAKDYDADRVRRITRRVIQFKQCHDEDLDFDDILTTVMDKIDWREEDEFSLTETQVESIVAEYWTAAKEAKFEEMLF